MSTAAALGFLLLATARNVAREEVRRLARPRHALAALVGVVWLLFMICTNRRGFERAGAQAFAAFADLGATLAWAAELMVLVLLSGVALAFWIFGRDEPGVRFTEAEIQLLFPAPLTRRELLAYKLAKGALAALALVMAFALLLGRGALAARLGAGLAGWVALETYMLHGTGATLTRAALAQHGVAALKRRAFTLLVAGLFLAALGAGIRRAPPLEAFPSGLAGVLAWSRALLETAPLSWALYPIRASLDVAFAPASASVAKACTAIAALGIHVLWVFSSDAAFEESSVEAARRQARRVEQIRGSGFEIRRGTVRRSFPLAAGGRPETALFWKACVRARRFVSVQAVAVASAAAVLVVVLGIIGSDIGPAGPIAALLSVASVVFVIFAGPFFATSDLRRDLPHLEILRALPVSGRRIVCAEMALPLAQLTAVQWALLAIATYLSSSAVRWHPGERVPIAIAVALVGPAISALGLLVQNALAVLYPSWFPRPGEVRFSLDRLGLPIVLYVATVVAVAVALLPASVVGVVAFVLLRGWLGANAMVAAALVSTGLVAAAFALGAVLVGRAFDRLEPEI